MIVEDAHWIDPTSRELLDLVVERVRSLPVLLIVTFRPEFQPPWIGQPQVTMLVLNRLDQRDRTSLVAQIAGNKTLPDEVLARIVERTDGVPLFVEELTKSVLESGLLREEDGHCVLDGPLPPLAIPTSLHASLMARLDRLASVRRAAQIGAAFGRWFRYTLLRAVSGLPENELQTALDRLVAVRRWPKLRRNFKRRWTSWHCCLTTANVSNRSSNFAAPWVWRCASSRGWRRPRPALPLPGRANCGSGWVLARSFCRFPIGSRSITRTAASSNWRGAWTRICSG